MLAEVALVCVLIALKLHLSPPAPPACLKHCLPKHFFTAWSKRASGETKPHLPSFSKGFQACWPWRKRGAKPALPTHASPAGQPVSGPNPTSPSLHLQLSMGFAGAAGSTMPAPTAMPALHIHRPSAAAALHKPSAAWALAEQSQHEQGPMQAAAATFHAHADPIAVAQAALSQALAPVVQAAVRSATGVTAGGGGCDRTDSSDHICDGPDIMVLVNLGLLRHLMAAWFKHLPGIQPFYALKWWVCGKEQGLNFQVPLMPFFVGWQPCLT